MGNWRKVNVVGTCAAEEIALLQELLTFDDQMKTANYGPLVSAGEKGLPNWGGRTEFDVVGLLAEDDFGTSDVGRHLETLRAACPSLDAKVHMGGNNESDTCTATVRLDEEGKVQLIGPQIERLREIGSVGSVPDHVGVAEDTPEGPTDENATEETPPENPAAPGVAGNVRLLCKKREDHQFRGPVGREGLLVCRRCGFTTTLANWPEGCPQCRRAYEACTCWDD